MSPTAFAVLACSIVAVAACDDPLPPWALDVEAVESADLTAADFDREASATATFSLPESYAGEVPDAYYRFEASFVRAGTLGEDIERVLLRATPLYPTSEGTRESTTILIDGRESSLAVYGELERCPGPASCERELRVRVGWLTPPPTGAEMALLATFAVGLRGGNADLPPPDASATAAFTFAP